MKFLATIVIKTSSSSTEDPNPKNPIQDLNTAVLEHNTVMQAVGNYGIMAFLHKTALFDFNNKSFLICSGTTIMGVFCV